jgi:hypothetical protein
MDLAPVVVGAGKRFFGAYAGTMLLSDPVEVVRGSRVVLHVRYRVEAAAEPSVMG